MLIFEPTYLDYISSTNPTFFSVSLSMAFSFANRVVHFLACHNTMAWYTGLRHWDHPLCMKNTFCPYSQTESHILHRLDSNTQLKVQLYPLTKSINVPRESNITISMKFLCTLLDGTWKSRVCSVALVFSSRRGVIPSRNWYVSRA